MKTTMLTVCVAMIAATGLPSGAMAQANSSNTVAVSGCARPIMPFCTTLTYRGTLYVLHGVNPLEFRDTYIRVTGKVIGNVGVCPGTQLQVASWRKARGACTQ